jgi:ribonuclease P protein component
LIVYFQPGVTGEARLGITASRKVGSSVVRQKVKRRIREIFRRWPGRPSLDAVDVVVHVKPEARQAPFLPLREDLERLLGALPKARRKAADPPPAGAES